MSGRTEGEWKNRGGWKKEFPPLFSYTKTPLGNSLLTRQKIRDSSSYQAERNSFPSLLICLIRREFLNFCLMRKEIQKFFFLSDRNSFLLLPTFFHPPGPLPLRISSLHPPIPLPLFLFAYIFLHRVATISLLLKITGLLCKRAL